MLFAPERDLALPWDCARLIQSGRPVWQRDERPQIIGRSLALRPSCAKSSCAKGSQYSEHSHFAVAGAQYCISIPLWPIHTQPMTQPLLLSKLWDLPKVSICSTPMSCRLKVKRVPTVMCAAPSTSTRRHWPLPHIAPTHNAHSVPLSHSLCQVRAQQARCSAMPVLRS